MPERTTATHVLTREQPAVVRYAIALLTTAAAVAASLVAQPFLPGTVFLFLFPAVVVSAIYGGLGPGLLATALAIVSADYWLISPTRELWPLRLADVVGLTIFALVAALLSSLSARLRRARRRAQREAAESAIAAEQLQAKAVELEQQTEEAQALAEELELTNDQLRHAATEAEEARDRLAESERRFRTLADTAPVLVWTAGTDGLRDFFNKVWLDFTGRTMEQELGNGWTEGVHPDDRQRCLEIYRPSFDARRPFRTDYRLRRHDGEYRWVLDSGVPRFTAEGDFAGYIGSCIDITDRRVAEQALRRSEQQYRNLVETTREGVWISDADGRTTYVNSRMAEVLGYPVAEMFGLRIYDFMPAEARAEAERNVAARLQGVREDHDFLFRRRDGSPVWMFGSINSLRDESGALTGALGLFTDITERKRAEDNRAFLAEASNVLASSLDYETTLGNVARLAVLSRADYVVINMVQDDGSVRDVALVHRDPTKEAALRALLAYEPAQSGSARGVAAVLRSGTAEYFAEVSDADRRALARSEEHARLLRQVYTTSAMIVPLVTNQKILGALTFGLSEAGRRYTPEDLALAEELARRAALAVENARLYAAERGSREIAESANHAKSEFLAVMSHELRTPLNAILGYTDLLIEGIVGSVTDSQRVQLGRVKTSAEHLLGLIDEVLSMSRLEVGREQARLEPTDVGAIAREAAELIERSAAPKQLSFETHLPAEPVIVATDATKVRQIALNLLSNAVKFTERGTIVLTLAVNGDRATMEICDTGIGIAPEHTERIFEPFWRVEQALTRKTGGTGLGLSVSRQLARLLGGDVSVRSIPGEGSVFSFWLPVREGDGP